MHEYCYSSRSPENIMDLQFVFVILNFFWGKQMQLTFVFWFKNHNYCWPDFATFVSNAQIRVATLMFGLLGLLTLMFGLLV